MQNIIDKIHDIPIHEGIGHFIELKKKGVNFQACCPFHNEKTPSFSVSPSKGMFNCFGCGEKGDLIAFVMKHENLDFVRAVYFLADRNGISYEKPELSKDQKQELEKRSNDRAEIFEVNKLALDYFKEQFLKNKDCINYLYGRDFPCYIAFNYEIGFAPDNWQGFYDYATEKGYKLDPLKKAGLVKQGQSRKYDTFRNRLMFPIRNASGVLVGFGGRDMSGDKEVPKYMNTAENPVYNKSKELYGLHHAVKAIQKFGEVNIVEGYTDVIRMQMLGALNTVAPCGTSLTIDHAKRLKRYTNTVNLVFDSDTAGLKAAERSGELLLKCKMNVSITPLPPGQDPDSYFQLEKIEYEQKD